MFSRAATKQAICNLLICLSDSNHSHSIGNLLTSLSSFPSPVIPLPNTHTHTVSWQRQIREATDEPKRQGRLAFSSCVRLSRSSLSPPLSSLSFPLSLFLCGDRRQQQMFKNLLTSKSTLKAQRMRFRAEIAYVRGINK